MPRRILILVGRPDPAPQRFCRALAEAYRDGAASAGHSVRVIDHATLDIPFLRSQEAFPHAGVPADLAPASAAIVEAEHIVLIFPLWLGTMPALLKAFLEQTMRPGLAFLYGAGPAGLPKPALAGRSARIVVTMGMPALAYRLWFRDHGIACLRRSTSISSASGRCARRCSAAWTPRARHGAKAGSRRCAGSARAASDGARILHAVRRPDAETGGQGRPSRRAHPEGRTVSG